MMSVSVYFMNDIYYLTRCRTVYNTEKKETAKESLNNNIANVAGSV